MLQIYYNKHILINIAAENNSLFNMLQKPVRDGRTREK